MFSIKKNYDFNESQICIKSDCERGKKLLK